MHDLIMSQHNRGDLLEGLPLRLSSTQKNNDDSACYKREAQKENKMPPEVVVMEWQIIFSVWVFCSVKC